jgi:prepilin-type N-terminal cleavage/methylation domain-containing protein
MGKRGMTFIEIMVVLVIVVLLFYMIFGSLISGMWLYNLGLVNTNLEESTEHVVNVSKEELYVAGRWLINMSIPRIQFQVPVDLDGDGDNVIQEPYGQDQFYLQGSIKFYGINL